MPHVFAVFWWSPPRAPELLPPAFGARQDDHQPSRRCRAGLSCAAAGGLAVLMLDLFRPRVVAITSLNPESVFALGSFSTTATWRAWGYLWFLLERRMNRYVRPAAIVAFFWQLLLITSTGLEFGFNFRALYDSLLYAPMFIAYSAAYGSAVFVLILFAVCAWEGRPFPTSCCADSRICSAFRRRFPFFAVLFLSSNTNLRDPRRCAVSSSTAACTALLWLGQLAIGGIVPPRCCCARGLHAPASLRPVLGGAGQLAQMYVT
jgi:hypothetical protein